MPLGYGPLPTLVPYADAGAPVATVTVTVTVTIVAPVATMA